MGPETTKKSDMTWPIRPTQVFLELSAMLEAPISSHLLSVYQGQFVVAEVFEQLCQSQQQISQLRSTLGIVQPENIGFLKDSTSHAFFQTCFPARFSDAWDEPLAFLLPKDSHSDSPSWAQRWDSCRSKYWTDEVCPRFPWSASSLEQTRSMVLAEKIIEFFEMISKIYRLLSVPSIAFSSSIRFFTYSTNTKVGWTFITWNPQLSHLPVPGKWNFAIDVRVIQNLVTFAEGDQNGTITFWLWTRQGKPK